VSERVYQLAFDAQGKMIAFQRGKTTKYPPLRYHAYAATVHFNARGVPVHACYDDEAQTHKDDRAFCRKLGHRPDH